MARDGSGNYSLPEAAFVYDTVISETAVNSNFSDIATALTASIAKDGQTNPTANLPMATYRHTGVGNASARTDYAAAGQVQDATFIWCGTAGGTNNALTFSPTPSIPAYVTGQRFRFKVGAAASDSTVTIAVSGLAAKAAQIDDAALSASVVLDANKYYDALYDGTAFQLTRLSPSAAASTPTTTRGDLIRRGASADERVALGADNTLLTSDGTDPGWETLTSLLDAALSSTHGAVLYRGASAWAALGVGTAGQVLATGGAAANPSWTDAGPVLLGTFTASAEATLDITGVFTSTYRTYVIEVDGVVPATDGADLQLRVSVASAFQSGATDYQRILTQIADNGADTASETNVSDSSASEIALNNPAVSGLGNGTNEKASATIRIRNPAAGNVVMVSWELDMRNSDAAAIVRVSGSGAYKGGTSAVDGVRLLMDTGNITGTAKVYGYS